MSLKSMLSDKPSQKELLLIIKNSLTRLKKDKSKNFFFNMTELFLLLIQEDANLKSTVDLVLEPDIKNLIDDPTCIHIIIYTNHHIKICNFS
jgi:hypothetical protein